MSIVKNASPPDPVVAPSVSVFHGINTKGVFIVVVVLLIIAGLFIYYGTPTQNKSIPDSASSVGPRGRAVSKNEFDENVGRAIQDEARLKKVSSREKPTKNEVIEKYESLLNKKPLSLSTGSINPLDKIRAEFAAAELKRALESRKSEISGQANGQQQSSAFSTAGTTPGSPTNDAILAAKQRLENARASVDSTVTGQLDTRSTPSAFSTSGNNIVARSRDTRIDGSSGIISFPNGYAGSNSTVFVKPPGKALIVREGTVIEIIAQSNGDSDNPGEVLLRVQRDVYDTTHTHIVIPALSTIKAQLVVVNTKNQAINKRVGFIASKLIRPDGLKIDLTDLSLLDGDGTTNVTGDPNYHLFPKILATVAYIGLSTATTKRLVRELSTQEDEDRDFLNEIICTTVTTSGNDSSTSGTDGSSTTTGGGTTNTDGSTTDDNGTDTTTGGSTDSTTTTTDDNNVTTSTTTNNSNSSVIVETCGPRFTFQDSGSGLVVNTDSSNSVEEAAVTNLSTRFDDILKQFFQPYIDLQTTISIYSGQNMKLILNADIYANSYGNIYEEYIN